MGVQGRTQKGVDGEQGGYSADTSSANRLNDEKAELKERRFQEQCFLIDHMDIINGRISNRTFEGASSPNSTPGPYGSFKQDPGPSTQQVVAKIVKKPTARDMLEMEKMVETT